MIKLTNKFIIEIVKAVNLIRLIFISDKLYIKDTPVDRRNIPTTGINNKSKSKIKEEIDIRISLSITYIMFT